MSKEIKVIPGAGMLLVEPHPVSNKTPSGLLIPDTALDKPEIGTVIRIGADLKNNIKEGDHVMFRKHGAIEIAYKNEPFLILRDADIYLIDPIQ